jgi:hypothetical protein
MTWVLALVGVLTAVPLGWAAADVAPTWVRHAGAPWFGGGAALGLLLGWVLDKRLPLLPVLEHELTHLLAALALFRRPRHLRAADEGGEVVYDGRGSTFIRLAPYAVPTLSLLALPVMPFVAPAWARHAVGLVGVTWGYHVWTTLTETRSHQPDLRAGGLVASYVAVASLGTVLFALAAIGAVGHGALLESWLHHGMSRARHLLSLALRQ